MWSSSVFRSDGHNTLKGASSSHEQGEICGLWSDGTKVKGRPILE